MCFFIQILGKVNVRMYVRTYLSIQCLEYKSLILEYVAT